MTESCGDYKVSRYGVHARARCACGLDVLGRSYEDCWQLLRELHGYSWIAANPDANEGMPLNV